MPRIVDATVDMTVGANGDPESFIWDRFEHTVLGQPQAMFARHDWWESPTIPTFIDTELWRLHASRGGEEERRYDLRKHADGRWVLALDWG